MKYGIALPYGVTRSIAKLSQAAEEAGWDAIFLGDAIWCEDPMIALAAAAVSTQRIRLGTMVIPMPLRRPWKVASESIALDLLSGGRFILGLGAGAVWMGWQGFPDEVSDARQRAEMLDESIDILTLMFQRKQFDFDGRHYHVKLSLLPEEYYPPRPIQHPRVPMWVPGIWPRKKSMQRALKCDGMLVEKLDRDGKPLDVTPGDVCEIKSYVGANRVESSNFDIVVMGKTAGMSHAQLQDKLVPLVDAGATWWVEAFWDGSEEQTAERIRQGPPVVI